MITADEARKLSGADDEDQERALDMADNFIRKAAGDGRREIIMRQSEWADCPGLSDKRRQLIRRCRQSMRDFGFEVEGYYDEGGQFFDSGTRIKW